MEIAPRGGRRSLSSRRWRRVAAEPAASRSYGLLARGPSLYDQRAGPSPGCAAVSCAPARRSSDGALLLPRGARTGPTLLVAAAARARGPTPTRGGAPPFLGVVSQHRYSDGRVPSRYGAYVSSGDEPEARAAYDSCVARPAARALCPSSWRCAPSVPCLEELWAMSTHGGCDPERRGQRRRRRAACCFLPREPGATLWRRLARRGEPIASTLFARQDAPPSLRELFAAIPHRRFSTPVATNQLKSRSRSPSWPVQDCWRRGGSPIGSTPRRSPTIRLRSSERCAAMANRGLLMDAFIAVRATEG